MVCSLHSGEVGPALTMDRLHRVFAIASAVCLLNILAAAAALQWWPPLRPRAHPEAFCAVLAVGATVNASGSKRSGRQEAMEAVGRLRRLYVIVRHQDTNSAGQI